MSLIVTAHDLETGAVTSTEVATPNNWRITAKVTGAKPSDGTHIGVYAEDEAGNWAVVTDDMGIPIKMMIQGNGVKSINPIVVNAANGRVYCYSATKGTGTLNVDSINS